MMIFWEVWVAFTVPFFIWLARFWFKHNPEASPWIVFPVSLIICVPFCLTFFFIGAVWRALDWSTRNG